MSQEEDTSFIINLPGQADDEANSPNKQDSNLEEQAFLSKSKSKKSGDAVDVIVFSPETDSLKATTKSCSKQPLQRADSKESFASTNKLMCRICHCEESTAGKSLITPCNCSGTLRHVHQSCLQKWLKISGIYPNFCFF
jgi:hypothetical protein